MSKILISFFEKIDVINLFMGFSSNGFLFIPIFYSVSIVFFSWCLLDFQDFSIFQPGGEPVCEMQAQA